MHTIKNTQFSFPGQISVYHGKVRDVYEFDNLLLMVATDRISAFDHILPEAIPFKGQVLNQTAAYFLEHTKDICPNWHIATIDENVTIGKKCTPFRVEMVIRGYLTGHSWRTYNEGKRELCGVSMREGMIENQNFQMPIITPTTKAMEGHDEDISREDIIKNGYVSEEDYTILEKYTRALFKKGQEMANQRGLILVDTKYEFGKTKTGEIVLIDEIHTPDSSRYFYLAPYETRLKNGTPQQQLSKEFVRQWLIEKGFQGKEGQVMPDMPPSFVEEISSKYIQLYEGITGKPFLRQDTSDVYTRIENKVKQYLTQKN